MDATLRYKVGDKVQVVNRGLEAFNAIGVISEIDTEWHIPYVIDFGDEIYEDEEIFEELFYESDLILVDETFNEIDNAADKEEAATPSDFIESFIKIKFQEGVIGEKGINGAQIEDVIDVLVERLAEFQNGDFSCRENALAITHLQEAQNWLYRRTMERRKQGVEGKNEKHQ